MRRSTLAAWIPCLLVVACAPSAPSVVSPPAATSAVMPEIAACRDAGARIDALEALVRANASAAETGCARAAVSAIATCASVGERATATLDAVRVKLRDKHAYDVTMSRDERWILDAPQSGDVRVFERTDAGVSLAMRVSLPGTPTFGPDGRLFVDRYSPDSLTVIDLAAHDARTFDGLRIFGLAGGDFYLADTTRVRRLAWPSLAPLGEVTSSIPLAPASKFRVAGGAVVTGDTLVSFGRQTILVRGLAFGPASRDGARIVACDDGKLEVLDTSLGSELARFDVAKSDVCSFAAPGLSPDGRFAVGVEARVGPNGNREMVAVVFDVATKKVTRRLERGTSLSTAMSASVVVEDTTPPRICVDFGNMHWHATECPWELDPSGTAAPAKPSANSKKSAQPSKGRSVKLADSILAEATSPDDGWRVVATAVSVDVEVYEHLALHVIDEKSGARSSTARSPPPASTPRSPATMA